MADYPVFRVTLMYNNDTKLFTPVFEETELAKQLNYDDKIELLQGAINVIKKAKEDSSK